MYKLKKQQLMVGWLMVFNLTFNNISLYDGSQIYWLRKPEYPEKTIDHWQTWSHNVISSTPRHEEGLDSQV
jgi:hypothetical protein